ncbi:hypothetical protein [Pseudohoeflea coraliihabitans]|uniref:Uncharacterized protein n=1 Tax=Pseudohoeflea coraliihabitans TaxID=2860393 RepID=A0ABS6WMH0_9HYPH|nr:hypothetical protein [Pseudohoeflea sp. DP4N28-3]MBW3097161.1 hypothetical protein [Pseudohoeflea sp. DP4N28-3]
MERELHLVQEFIANAPVAPQHPLSSITASGIRAVPLPPSFIQPSVESGVVLAVVSLVEDGSLGGSGPCCFVQNAAAAMRKAVPRTRCSDEYLVKVVLEQAVPHGLNVDLDSGNSEFRGINSPD